VTLASARLESSTEVKTKAKAGVNAKTKAVPATKVEKKSKIDSAEGTAQPPPKKRKVVKKTSAAVQNDDKPTEPAP
jgi:hypothetical protein